jgi:RNA polymerase sigma factor (sigma-70 family)
METDLRLIERWRGGDRGAGQELFARHFAEIFRFFTGKVRAKAEDLAQQTFLECVRNRDQFRGDSTFRTYLFGIAWNELRQHLRREVRNGQVDFDVSSMEELATCMTSPSSQIDRANRASKVRNALSKLPVSQQVLLEYHYWHELDAPALAEIFGISAGAVRVRLLRARATLKQHLDQLASAGLPSMSALSS